MHYLYGIAIHINKFKSINFDAHTFVNLDLVHDTFVDLDMVHNTFHRSPCITHFIHLVHNILANVV